MNIKFFLISFILINILLFSCTSIKNNRAIIMPNDSTYSVINRKEVKTINSLSRGNLLVLLQSSRGGVPYSPNIKEEILKLKDKDYIDEIEFRNIDYIDLESIDYELNNAFNFKYALIISYYSNNAVNQAMLHTFLKSATLNLYDLVPVFSVPIGAFYHNYAITLEASLVDVKSTYIIKNYKETVFSNKRIRGSTKAHSVSDIYKIDLIKKAALNLVAKM
jgi:hypothetical protein